jgi:hypothetical protein
VLLRMRLEDIQIFTERDQVLGQETLVAFGQQTHSAFWRVRPLDRFPLRLVQTFRRGGGKSRQAECRQL